MDEWLDSVGPASSLAIYTSASVLIDSCRMIHLGILLAQ